MIVKQGEYVTFEFENGNEVIIEILKDQNSIMDKQMLNIHSEQRNILIEPVDRDEINIKLN
jgi:hypothetical protein